MKYLLDTLLSGSPSIRATHPAVPRADNSARQPSRRCLRNTRIGRRLVDHCLLWNEQDPSPRERDPSAVQQAPRPYRVRSDGEYADSKGLLNKTCYFLSSGSHLLFSGTSISISRPGIVSCILRPIQFYYQTLSFSSHYPCNACRCGFNTSEARQPRSR